MLIFLFFNHCLQRSRHSPIFLLRNRKAFAFRKRRSDMKHQLRFEGFAEKVRRSFDRQSLMQTFSARLRSIEPGACTIEAPILHGHRQQHGFAHAGLTFALGDSAAGYAALSLMSEEAEVLTV